WFTSDPRFRPPREKRSGMRTFHFSDLNRRSRESGNPAIQPGPWVPALRCVEPVLGPAEGRTRGAGTTRMTRQPKAFRICVHAVVRKQGPKGKRASLTLGTR